MERHDDARQDGGRRSRWARIGSTNLNINSWLGNWELDVAIEDDTISRATMEAHYEEDLSRSTEIVHGRASPRRQPAAADAIAAARSARRALRTVTGLGHSVGAAVTGNRHSKRGNRRRSSPWALC